MKRNTGEKGRKNERMKEKRQELINKNGARRKRKEKEGNKRKIARTIKKGQKDEGKNKGIKEKQQEL